MATILLAEDEKTMRLLTSAKLRNQFTILCACDGVEAWRCWSGVRWTSSSRM